jgi:hypothetical protein
MYRNVYDLSQYNIPISKGSLVTTIKVKAKQISATAAMFSFHILQKIILTITKHQLLCIISA